ncbi:hypothetical protein SEUCBS139899_004220 [Sporothrix eucalyptigena]|uniref:Uncharacterized protein n=1 Tax=Sporothrix eucalyptigena TaxID=1812306 RepID=A0ABP0B0K4_9PEZI
MLFIRLALASAFALFSSAILAAPNEEPRADNALFFREAEALPRCTGGLEPDPRCVNGQTHDGCYCRGGAYLCQPNTWAKKGGLCAKCGC